MLVCSYQRTFLKTLTPLGDRGGAQELAHRNRVLTFITLGSNALFMAWQIVVRCVDALHAYRALTMSIGAVDLAVGSVAAVYATRMRKPIAPAPAPSSRYGANDEPRSAAARLSPLHQDRDSPEDKRDPASAGSGSAASFPESAAAVSASHVSESPSSANKSRSLAARASYAPSIFPTELRTGSLKLFVP